jgi:hypothetical protein
VTGHLQAITTVLSLVNPFMCAAIFVQIEAGKSPGAQLGNATKVALTVVPTTVMWFLIVLVARLGARGSGGFVHDTVTRWPT